MQRQGEFVVCVYGVKGTGGGGVPTTSSVCLPRALPPPLCAAPAPPPPQCWPYTTWPGPPSTPTPTHVQAAPSLKQKACTPLFPSYVADLTDAGLKKAGATDAVVKSPVGFTFGDQVYGCLVNNQNFSYPDPNPVMMPLGSVVEWKFTNLMEVREGRGGWGVGWGASAVRLEAWGHVLCSNTHTACASLPPPPRAQHPLHLHTNPFQIVELRKDFLIADNEYTSWFEVGDWHDTLQMPVIAAPNNVTQATVSVWGGWLVLLGVCVRVSPPPPPPPSHPPRRSPAHPARPLHGLLGPALPLCAARGRGVHEVGQVGVPGPRRPPAGGVPRL